MGLLEKSEDFLNAKESATGLAARARSILRGNRGRRKSGQIREEKAFSTGIARQTTPDSQFDPAAPASRLDALSELAASVPDLSVILAYDLKDVPDPEIVEKSARKIVDGHGDVQRASATSLFVVLHNMESADPGLTLAQFGKALVKTYAELMLPPPGSAFRIDRRIASDSRSAVIPG